MNDQDLRQLVRQALAKTGVVQGQDAPQRSSAPAVQFVPSSVPFGDHASHAMYLQLVNDNGGACLIEPAVPCNHCGFCQSHGH